MHYLLKLIIRPGTELADSCFLILGIQGTLCERPEPKSAAAVPGSAASVH
jgi:hypothetical protein